MFRLAERLGCTVAGLSARLRVDEFYEWVALAVLDEKDAEFARQKAEKGMR